MEQCFEAWLRISTTAAPYQEARELVGRSWFQQQLVREAFAQVLSTRFKAVPPTLQELLRDLFTGLGQTKVVEDGIHQVSLAASDAPNKQLGARRKWE
eukprot:1424561-Lingulodinium_polyedra.AAC.1